MKHPVSPEQVSREYAAAVQFNNGIDLYHCVQTNENFFIGKQWEGVQSNGLPTPVFNFLKRVVLFCVANVSTDNLKLHAHPLPGSGYTSEKSMEVMTDLLNDQFRTIFEENKIGGLVREFCRNAAVDGDGCMFVWWKPGAFPGQRYAFPNGSIQTEILRNTQVMFGNPNCRDVQSQPYILIERRMILNEARRRAKQNGQNPELILPDDKESDEYNQLDRLGGEKVSVFLRIWRDETSGSIHAFECTRSAVIHPAWDLGIQLYPIVWMNWDYIQDCYHGQAMITGLIPNQIFVNKLFAMCMISLMTLAYPKVIYDRTKIAKWSNRVGAAIAVNGSVENVARNIDPAAVSPQISQFIELAIGYTQKFLGASDAALGDARPDNSSAIIALQRAAATPLELTRQNLLQTIEDLGRIYMEFMSQYYGSRYVEIKIPNAPKIMDIFDFSILKHIPFSIDLDAGASSYWSEIASMQTLDNLLLRNRISTVEYLKRLPSGQISNRDELIEALEREEELSHANV